ncbi:MAG: hypothetical protein KDA60_21565, partial [Planctomycetales bacterium]|nr:hypothetical protein [Planctomycetales bacterium]
LLRPSPLVPRDPPGRSQARWEGGSQCQTQPIHRHTIYSTVACAAGGGVDPRRFGPRCWDRATAVDCTKVTDVDVHPTVDSRDGRGRPSYGRFGRRTWKSILRFLEGDEDGDRLATNRKLNFTN